MDNVTRLFVKLLPAQFFLVISSGITAIINGLIVGNYLNPNAMRAIGLVAPLTALLAALSSVVSGGSVVLCGRYMGKGEVKKIDEVFVSSILLILGIGISLTFIIFIFSNGLAYTFGARNELLIDTSRYIQGISLGIIPLLILPSYMVFLQIHNKSFITLLCSIVVAILNLIFGLLNVFIFKGGIRGMGISSSVSNYLTAIFVTLYLFKNQDLVTFNPKLFNRQTVRDVLYFGSPNSVDNVLYALRNVFINRFALIVGGEIAVSALAILGSFGIFFDVFNIVVGNVIAILASVFVGEKNLDSLKRLMKSSMIIAMGFCLFKLVVAFFLGGNIAQLFGAQGEIISLTRELLIWYAISAPFNMVALLFVGVLQAQGKVAFINILFILNCLLVPLFCCTILSKIFGITAIWVCYTLSEIVTLFVIYIKAIRTKKGRVKTIEDLFMLSDDLTDPNKITISIKDINEVVTISKQIQDYCQENNIEHKRAMYAALCMEEMAANVIEHGFKKDNKEHSLDIYASIEDDEITLRLRDNCIPFDPKTKLSLTNNDDPFKNIGIKMVYKLAKEMNYQTTFGMNVLTIKL